MSECVLQRCVRESEVELSHPLRPEPFVPMCRYHANGAILAGAKVV